MISSKRMYLLGNIPGITAFDKLHKMPRKRRSSVQNYVWLTWSQEIRSWFQLLSHLLPTWTHPCSNPKRAVIPKISKLRFVEKSRKILIIKNVCLSVRCLSPLITPDPLIRFWRNFLRVICPPCEWQKREKKKFDFAKKNFDFAIFSEYFSKF